MTLVWVAMLVVLVSGQYQQFTQPQVHSFMKAKGFYSGAIDAAWSKESKEAFKAYSAVHGDGYQGEGSWTDVRHHFFQNKIADHFQDVDPSAIKPQKVGLFFVSFNKASCGSASTIERCRLPDYPKVIDDLKKSVKDFAMGTRGIVRLDFNENHVHHISVLDVGSTPGGETADIRPAVKSELDFDPNSKYTFRAYILPQNSNVGVFASASAEAYGRDSFFVLPSRHNFDHELSHNLGLSHCGVESNGRYDEYGGHTTCLSNSGYSWHALDLIALRVIHRNTIQLTRSKRGVQIDSLTSLSNGYVIGEPFSKISGIVAALYQSPEDGPEYSFEWRKRERQDSFLDGRYIERLLIHHKRDDKWRTLVDASLAVGERWTAPRGDVTISHGPILGTFDIEIDVSKYDKNVKVNFFNWHVYWRGIKEYQIMHLARQARLDQERAVRTGRAMSSEQLQDVVFLKRLREMCETHSDPRCEAAIARLEELGQ